MNIQDLIKDKIAYDIKAKQDKLIALDAIFGQANRNSQKYINAYKFTSLTDLQIEAEAIRLHNIRRAR